MMRKTICFLLTLLCSTVVFAQNTIGLPDITNYSKHQFQGGSQTYDIQTDARGVMYFANNEGLLTFNGKYWKVYPIPNGTRLRSIALDKDRIYVGAQDEIGYFSPDSRGELAYTSLKPLLPKTQKEFADVWNIEVYDKGVFFRSFDKIFHYKDNNIAVFNPVAEWRYLARTANGLYAQELTQGLLKFENGKWTTVSDVFAKNQMLITAVLAYSKDSLLITTLKHGLFWVTGGQTLPYHTEADALLYSNRIYCATLLPNKELIAGTTSSGCYIISPDGKVVQKFGVAEGLQNNNVLKIFADKKQNLWLALDYGIDMVRYNTAIKHINPLPNNLLTTYAANVFNNQLYVGTSDGLYVTPLNNDQKDLSFSHNPFTLVANTKGQTWNLSEVNNHLLLGHHEGTFDIQGNTGVLLLKDVGSWLYTPLSQVSGSSKVLMGTYNGLRMLRFNNGQYASSQLCKTLNESLRFLAIDNNSNIWSSHPYRGVFKINLTSDSTLTYKLYGQAQGLPSALKNYAFRIKNRVVIATDKGIYEYVDEADKFKPSPMFFGILGSIPVNYATEDKEGNVWFVSNKQVGVIDFQKPAGQTPYSVIYFPELRAKTVGGFEFIYPYNNENILIGSEKGVYHLNYKKYLQASHQPPGVMIGQVKAKDDTDSLIYGGYATASLQSVRLPHRYNNFHFEFSSTTYEQENGVEYAYQLIGFDKNWSEWTTKTEKEYTNLPYGNYTFRVKARNNLGIESQPAEYTFYVAPAWYQTWFAVAVYVLLLAGAIYLVYKRQKRKFATQRLVHEKEQEHLRYMHQLELDRNEKELIKLQKEKLEADVQYKNKELASATMHLVERGKVLSKIKEELMQALKKTETPATPFKRVIRLLDDAESNDEDWEHFSTHFDQVHSNFLSTIKNKFPKLTPTDLKLCAYLRINLSSKEIAQLMGISVRGVEISRYRLRKKLALPQEVSLFDFLQTTAPGDIKDFQPNPRQPEPSLSAEEDVLMDE